MILEHRLRIPEWNGQHGHLVDGHLRESEDWMQHEDIKMWRRDGRELRTLSRDRAVVEREGKTWPKEASSIAEQMTWTKVLKKKILSQQVPQSVLSQDATEVRRDGDENELGWPWTWAITVVLMWPMTVRWIQESSSASEDLTPTPWERTLSYPVVVYKPPCKPSQTPLFPAKPNLDFTNKWASSRSMEQPTNK